MARMFNEVQPPKLKRSKFNLSHEVKLDCDMGQLIPICAVETVPGDYFKISEECVIRTVPLVAPVLQEINAYVHYFFVPYRILFDSDNDWTVFLTGGKDGTEVAPPLPRWNPNSSNSIGSNGLPSGSTKYSLWDYFGFPVGITNFSSNGSPLAFPKRAYNLIWNDFYRDENQQDEIDLDTETVQFRNVQKDYFTSALPWIIRGVMPTIDLSAFRFEGIPSYIERTGWNRTIPNNLAFVQPSSGTDTLPNLKMNLTGSDIGPDGSLAGLFVTPKGSVSGFSSVGIEQLRQLFAQERWLRRNALGGVRYDEFLLNHFATAPRSEVLDEPEYIGGVKMPMMVSEVSQTSQTTSGSPQGKLTGNGLTANGQYVGSYRAKEYGVIIGILSVLPTQTYSQGIPRAWLKEDRFDFYFPEFSDLDAQPVWNEEIFATSSSSFNSADIFGYQGRFDELRYIPSRIAGGFRDTYDYWHLSRRFASAPRLNSDFMSAKYYSTQDGKRIFSVQEDDMTKIDAERTLLINYRNIITAVRPLPYMPH